MGKGENAGDQHFFRFWQCFLPYQMFSTQSKTSFAILATWSSANVLKFSQSIILSFGKELMECSKLLQNVMECRCLIHKMLRNAEAEARECSEMIYQLIYAPTYCNILWS